MNTEDENIDIGRQIHRETYSRKKKNLQIGPISIDFSKYKGKVQIFEIKKSSRLKKPALYQLYYYLWYLSENSINAEGYLVYPKENKKKKVVLTEEKKKEMKTITSAIRHIISKDKPPEIEEKPYCENCSYFEFCQV